MSEEKKIMNQIEILETDIEYWEKEIKNKIKLIRETKEEIYNWKLKLDALNKDEVKKE